MALSSLEAPTQHRIGGVRSEEMINYFIFSLTLHLVLQIPWGLIPVAPHAASPELHPR